MLNHFNDSEKRLAELHRIGVAGEVDCLALWSEAFGQDDLGGLSGRSESL